MKYILILVHLFQLGYVANGQVILLDRATELIKDKDYPSAIQALDKALAHVTTANDPRTHYLHAFLYKEQLQQLPTEKSPDELRNMLFRSIHRCKSLDIDSSYKQPIQEIEAFILAVTFNSAANAFNKQDYKTALHEYGVYIKYTRVHDARWLDALYFKGVSYQELQQYDSAIQLYELVTSHMYDQPLTYFDLSNLYAQQQNEYKALSTINAGVSRYPENYDLLIAQLNTYSVFGRYAELEKLAENFLRKDSLNIDVMLLAATAYERNKSSESHQLYITKLEKLYKRIVELEPKHFDANYNLGVLYYNEAVELVNNSDLETDLAQLTQVLEVSTSYFEHALPYLRNALEVKPDARTILTALQAVYYNLNMKSELNAVNQQLQESGK